MLVQTITAGFYKFFLLGLATTIASIVAQVHNFQNQ